MLPVRLGIDTADIGFVVFYLSDQLSNIELCLVSQNWFMLETNAP